MIQPQEHEQARSYLRRQRDRYRHPGRMRRECFGGLAWQGAIAAAAGAPAPWTLADLGAKLWGAWPNTSITDSAGLVPAWNDTVSTRHMTGAGTNHPNYLATGGANGGKAVQMDSNSFLNGPNYNGLTQGEIWYRLRVPVPTGSYGLQVSAASDTADYYNFATGPAVFLGWGSSVRKSIGNQDATAQTLQQTWHRLAISSSSGNYTVLRNNVQIFTTGTNTVAFPAASTRFGNNGVAASALEFDYVVVCNAPLTSDERLNLDAFLAAA